MKRNESTLDRVVRAVAGVGAGAVAVAVGVSTAGGVVLLAVGAILLMTAATGFCPLYRLLGLSTYRAAAEATPAQVEARR